ncbi:hypothetical protein K2173_025077 [Erythroxylum novogranatense]|uniref:FMR1-interacting protein 1 conserved domain-containing protein n=1 Tax=Erythroxylum novogranatense TaxID=1862640 RepID=A0AAV8SVF3_9ROSI|nr:hypothetical protein K2173_025077 [Erythroxylum novogranatense]
MQPRSNSQHSNQFQFNVVSSAPQHQQPMGTFNPQLTLPSNYSNTLIQSPLTALAIPPGFYPQNLVNNSNSVPMFLNQCQLFGQNFPPNFSNLPRQLLHNFGFPNLQVPNFQTPVQNLNHAVPMQMPNLSQECLQALGTLSPNFFVNPMVSVGNGQQLYPNEQNLAVPANNGNTSKPMPVTTQVVQGNSFALNSESSAFTRQQGNRAKNNGHTNSKFNGKNFHCKDFRRNIKKEALNSGYQKSQFHHIENRKRKFVSSNGQKETGHGYERAAKFSPLHPMNQTHGKKRSLALTYTEQEIRIWHEQRRKNYPSKANIEKQAEKLADPDAINRETKLRREQLKEILSKQAELGVEVAEIPSHYLTDSQKQAHGTEGNGRPFTKKGRSRNRHAKRGRDNRNKWSKQQESVNKDPSKRQLSLLQKLLSSDIRRDKHRLLQVLRFMVMNSFFEDWPEKALKYPLVVLKEDGFENEILKSSLAKNALEITNKTVN